MKPISATRLPDGELLGEALPRGPLGWTLPRRLLRAALLGLFAVALAAPAAAQTPGKNGPGKNGPDQPGKPAAVPAPPMPRSAAGASPLQVYAFTLRHQPLSEAASMVRLRLTPRGTVEEQPGGNTLVVRDVPTSIDHIRRLLEAFDVPPEEIRFDIRVVQAGPKRAVISPPTAEAALDEELATRLRGLLRYEDFRVLAQAAVTSRAGELVEYALGADYDVAFRLVSVVEGQRVKLEGFKVLRRPARAVDKSRQLAPQPLFQATLNLWLDKPFTLVLTQDEARKEALMIAISCRREKAP